MIYDVLVIGGGISGAAVAYELANSARVLVLERESSCGYHSTGRSAALFTRNYGNPIVRQINALSAAFFAKPPDGFCDGPLLTPRGALTVASAEAVDQLSPLLALSEPGEEVVSISVAEALERAPYLRKTRCAAAIFEPNVTDIDVASLHQGFLKGLVRRGGSIVTRAEIRALAFAEGVWSVETRAQTYHAKTIVNAAGAWADDVARLAGATQIGLVPKRRTCVIIEAPSGLDLSQSPAVDFLPSGAYIKPEAGKLMASPGDATPTGPQDVRPEEMDIAELAYWIETETLIQVPRIEHSWAGLRSFVTDEAPVVGFDAKAPGFFWLAAQGGYGIMMAPALAQFAAGLLLDQEPPSGSALDAAGLSPRRLDVPWSA